MDSQVQLVFYGEVLRGHRRSDVMHDMGELLELDQAECAALFSGARIVLKASMDFFDAQGYEERLREMGARVHIEPADPEPGAKPDTTPAASAGASAAPAASAPAPLGTVASAPAPSAGATGGAPAAPGSGATPDGAAASALTSAEEEVTCPHCGARQSKRIMCRACGTDIPMALAYKRETEAEARAHRIAQLRARRGLPPLPGEPGADAPSTWGVGFSGRIGRLPYITATALVLAGINLLFVYAIPNPSPARLYAMLGGTLLLAIFAVRLGVLRLHDFNGNGWWALLLLVPYAGAAVLLALAALPGMAEENDHGGPPRHGNPIAAMLSVALIVVLLVATYRWVATLVEEVIPTGAAATPVQTEIQIAARLPSPDAVAAFRDQYMAAPVPKAFAVSATGSWDWKAGAPSSEAAAAMALEACDAKRKPYTTPCELVNVNGGWIQR
jgi:uncharacterized membrane protein YhaH (DUF805 family)